MRSPFVAMLWDQWLRTRWIILAIVGACLASHLVLYAATWIWSSPLEIGHVARLNLLYCSWCCIGFGIANLGKYYKEAHESLDAGPGGYLLTMPVSTWGITCMNLVYMAVVVGVIASGIAVLSKSLFGDFTFDQGALAVFPYRVYPIFCITMALLLQSIMFFCGIKNEALGLLVIGVQAALFVGGCLLMLTQQPALYSVPAWLFGCVAAGVVSHVGVGHYRCQRTESATSWLIDLFGVGAGRALPFKNADGALRWYAGRRYGKLFLVVTAICLLGAFLASLLICILHKPEGREITTVSRDLIGVMFGTIGLSGLLFGLFALLLDVTELTRCGNILMVLPVQPLRMAWAALGVSAAAFALTGLAVALLTVPLLCVCVGPGAWNEMISLPTVVVAAGSVLTGWIVMLLAIPLFCIGLVLLAVEMVASHFVSAATVSAIICSVLSACLILAAVAGLIIAWRGRYLARKNLAYMGVALAVGLCASGWAAAASRETMTAAHYAALFSAALLVPLPFALFPALIDMGRHR